MKRTDFLKSLIGIPVALKVLDEIPKQTDAEIANELVKRMRRDGINVTSKVNPPEWEFTGEWRYEYLSHEQIDVNKESPTYGVKQWVHLLFFKDPRMTVIV